MLKLGDLFARIKNVQAQELVVRNSVKDSLNKVANIGVPAENISIRSGVVSIKGLSQGERSVIFIKKQKILEEIGKIQTVKKISDIR
jgi:hypothetical protein